MSQENQKPRRRAYKSLRHPEAAALVDEWEEVSTLTPAEVRRYMGHR
jgi:hypothetical protein